MDKGERLTKENVIENTRAWFMAREMVVSTLFGLTVVVGMRVTDNVWSILGLIALVFVVYYILISRKSKLNILETGSLMYYTEDLDRQVIRISHYDHGKIKGHLFNFGVLNIIYLELIGVVMMVDMTFLGKNEVWVKVISTVVIYMLAYNYISKKHAKEVDKELLKLLDNKNKGILVTLTSREKEEIKGYYEEVEGNRNEDESGEEDKELEDKELEDKELEDKELEDKELEDKELEDKELEDKELEDKELEDKELEDKELEDKEGLIENSVVSVLGQVAYKKETELKNKDIVTVKPYNEEESKVTAYERKELAKENKKSVEDDDKQESIVVKSTEYSNKVIESKLLAYKKEMEDKYGEEYTSEEKDTKDEDTKEEDITEDFLEDIQVITDVKSMSLTNGYYKK